MCATCGCNGEGHEHSHEHHHHHHQEPREVRVEKDILYENNLLAERNRGYFGAKSILALNLVSSPGSGKTTLLERTLRDTKGLLDSAVIEGDQQTRQDALRIEATGTPVWQINTGKGCHLDAHMVLHAIKELKPEDNSVLFIENVGNLICPSMFDLGEQERVVIFSVTEGDDKPLKYPDMFRTATLCIVNKIDLLPYVPFSIERAREHIRQIHPDLTILEVSCTSGAGLGGWYDWLKTKAEAVCRPTTFA